MKEVDNDDRKEIILWPNGKRSDNTFSININSSVDSLRKFKECLYFQQKINTFDKIRLFNHKGIELDDTDISYLTNKQIVYISFDGAQFSNVNYYNEYEYVKSIKKGGYAEVYLAKHSIHSNLVSIKKTDLHNFSSEELYNISREAVYLSTLIHKNIIKMYGSFTYNGYLFNVMDYAEGGELTLLLYEPGQIPEKRIKDIFRQILNAVSFVHSKNVIHRDLKTNNILFLDKEKTHVVIIDFGISGHCNGKSREIIRAGTLKYTPPEMLSEEGYHSSPKIDNWALGVILYLMCFKEFPFDGNDIEATEKIIKMPVRFPKKKNLKIKKSLVKLIEGLLCKNPNRRIDLDNKLFDAWFNDESNEYAVIEEDKQPRKLNGMTLFSNKRRSVPIPSGKTKSTSQRKPPASPRLKVTKFSGERKNDGTFFSPIPSNKKKGMIKNKKK